MIKIPKLYLQIVRKGLSKIILNRKQELVIKTDNMVILILLIGSFLRVVYYLLNFPLNFDEAVVWKLSTDNDLQDLLTGNYWEVRFHPPLYYLLNHLYVQINNSEYFLRFPSLLFSILSLYILYKLVKINTDRKTALYSIILYSFLPFSLFYSIQLRVYSLLFLISLLYFYHYELTKRNSIFWYSFISLGIVGFKLDYSFVFTYLIINFYYLFSTRKHISYIKWIMANFLILLSIIPSYIYFLYHKSTLATLSSINWVPIHGLRSLWNVFAELIYSEKYSSYLFQSNKLLLISVSTLLSVYILIILYQSFSSGRKYLLFNCVLFIPILISFCLNFFYPVFISKSIFISSAGLVVLLAVFVRDHLESYLALKMAFLIVTIISFIIIYPFFNSEPDWKKAKSIFLKNNNKSKYIFTFPRWNYHSFSYYNQKYKLLDFQEQILNSGKQRYYDEQDEYNMLVENKFYQNNCVLFDNNYLTNELKDLLDKYPDKLSLGSNINLYCR